MLDERTWNVLIAAFAARLISRSGLAYGLDAALAPYLPAAAASTLVSASPGELPSTGGRAAQPAGLSAA
jgi:hypothetical protein